MTAPIGPVTGLSSAKFEIRPQAPPESMHGGPVKQAHASPGEQAQPYPWEEFAGPHGPYGIENELLSETPEQRTLPAGYLAQDPSGDQTPYHSHAGPITKGMPASDRDPLGTAEYLNQSWQAHGVKTNAGAKGVASSNPLQDQWNGFWNTVPGDDALTDNKADGQVGPSSFGFGVNDHRSNAFAKVNSFGLAASHRMRRYAQSPIPGNTMWMRPGGRPMVKTVAGTSKPPVGEGPFYGQDMTRDYGIQGVVLMDPATEYVAPPQPYVTPELSSAESPPVIELW